MKNKVLLIAMIFSVFGFSQDTLKIATDTLETRIFSFTPRSKKVSKVNGLTFGLGVNCLLDDNSSIKKINGINIEVNPVSLLVVLFADPDKVSWTGNADFVLNGLNISSGTNNNAIINGMNISLFNISNTNNGVSINGFYNYSKDLNGLHISGIANSCENSNGLLMAIINNSDILKGIQIGGFNKSVDSKGLQIGLYNKSVNHIGIQIGLFNFTNKMKGLQLGFWNINGKRSMPFLNF